MVKSNVQAAYPVIVRKKAYIPKYYKCVHCGVKGKRVKKWAKRYRDIAYKREAYVDITYGVYKARCGCQKYFVGATPWAPKGGHYTYAVQDEVMAGLVRDRMNYTRLRMRLQEDFLVSASPSAIFRWFNKTAEHPGFFCRFEQWSARIFSGIVCMDEVYEGKLRIFIATDCVADIPLAYMISDKADEKALDCFLTLLEQRGLKPVVAITDGSILYKESLRERWKGLEHQLCIFHVLKDFNDVVIAEVRTLRRRLAAQGNKGRKKKRGRVSQQVRYQRERASGKKDDAKFVWEYQYLLVKKRALWSQEDHQAFERLCRLEPSLRTLRLMVKQFHELFERGISKQQARYRRTRLLNNPDFQRLGCFNRIARMISKPLFNKMIVFLGHANLDRTSNHVERINRGFRMTQKTRYKRRTMRTIENAIRHEWMYLMTRHPLYTPEADDSVGIPKDFSTRFYLRKHA